MRAFEYLSPTTKEQVVALLGDKWGEIEILAGGTDLLSLMKDEIVAPRKLVNIKEVTEFNGIRFSASSGLRIGSLVTIQDLLDNEAVRKNYPAIHQAADGITSAQIRAMGTAGGDLCQRPRCWYYRAGHGLLATDPSGGSLVPQGENQYHAILGNSGPAYFVNPSSLAPALIALGAKIILHGAKGSRDVPAAEFFVTPRAAEQRENTLQPNEVLAEILVPAPAPGSRSATYEVRQREALDWPLAAAAVNLTLSGNTVRSARIALGHVAPIPWPAAEAEKYLAGKTVDESVAQEAGSRAVSGAKSLSKNGYKIQLARVAVKRAILRAAQGG